MKVKEYQILFYQTATGKQPLVEWINGLKDKRTESAILSRIKRVQTGILGDCKSLKGKSVLELRIDFGPGYRVYFAFEGETIILLLCGGAKKSQDSDIERAEKYLKDYRERI